MCKGIYTSMKTFVDSDIWISDGYTYNSCKLRYVYRIYASKRYCLDLEDLHKKHDTSRTSEMSCTYKYLYIYMSICAYD